MTPPKSALFELRDYQHEAIDAVFRADCMKPAIVLPTGSGKTVIFAELAKRFLEAYPRDGRVIVLVHRDELVRQAVGKLRQQAPHLRIGVVKAEENELDADVIVASVQTLSRDNRLGDFTDIAVGLVIVDEAHHATADSYTKITSYFATLTVGLTATMERSDGVALKRAWDKIVYTRDVVWMIRRGYLADVEGVQVKIEDFDLSKVKTGRDYNEAALGDALMEALAPELVAQKYLELCTRADGSLRPGIVFAPTVETAQAFAAEFVGAGIRAAAVWGAQDMDERRRTLRDYEHGRLDVLCNCMVLTEGFDSPRAEVAVIARPTSSRPLYVQMVGRVLRVFPGKIKALVMDVVGAAGKHELATLATLAGAAPRPPKPGQSLLEALEEYEAEKVGELLTQYAHGPTTVEAIDLFGGSRQEWLRTRAGHWFIPAGDRYISVTEGKYDDTYEVAWWAAKQKKGQVNGGWVAREVYGLQAACVVGEREIAAGEASLTRKEGRWRKQTASKASLDYLQNLTGKSWAGQGYSNGEVSNMIAIILASMRLDTTLTKMLRAYGREQAQVNA